MPWCVRGCCLDDLPVLVVVVALLAGIRLDGVAVRELVAVVPVLGIETREPRSAPAKRRREARKLFSTTKLTKKDSA